MSFLDQLQQMLPRMSGLNGQPGDFIPLMPQMRGGVNAGSHPILARLRRQQLVDLARGFGVKINPDAPKWAILSVMEAAEMNGVFNNPPVNPYYAERAKYSSDTMKDLKAKVHPSQWPKCLQDIKAWDGPSPDCDLAEPVEPEYVSPARIASKRNMNELNELKKEAKALGLNSKWKRTEELRQMIAKHKGEMNAGPTQTAA